MAEYPSCRMSLRLEVHMTWGAEASLNHIRFKDLASD